MRFTCLLLLILLPIGCGGGSGMGSHDPRSIALTPPSITALTPNSVPVNSVPFTMTIDGHNFGTDAIVFWNGTPHNTTFVTSDQLLVMLTDTDLMFVGLIRVFVRTGGLNSNTVDFAVTSQ